MRDLSMAEIQAMTHEERMTALAELMLEILDANPEPPLGVAKDAPPTAAKRKGE